MNRHIIISIMLSVMLLQAIFPTWAVSAAPAQDESPAGDVFDPSLNCGGCMDYYQQTGSR